MNGDRSDLGMIGQSNPLGGLEELLDSQMQAGVGQTAPEAPSITEEISRSITGADNRIGDTIALLLNFTDTMLGQIPQESSNEKIPAPENPGVLYNINDRLQYLNGRLNELYKIAERLRKI